MAGETPSIEKAIEQIVEDPGKKKTKSNGLKTRSYVVKPNLTTSISSGSIILTIGMIIGLSVPAIDLNNQYDFSRYEVEATPLTQNPVWGIIILLFDLTLGLFLQYQENQALNIETIIVPFILGWFIGGLIAAFLFDADGRNGPYYSSIIIITFTFTLVFIIGVLSLIITGSFNSFQDILPFQVILILFVGLAVLSIPLIIMAQIGYKLGGYING